MRQGPFPPLSTSWLLCLLAPLAVWALPDDRDQEVVVDASSSELLLDQEMIIYRGEEDDPAVITQGSMRIAGLEIVIERRGGEPGKVTVKGNPAHFQQQPEKDKSLIHASGSTIIYDNDAQMVTVEGSARFIHEGNTLSSNYIEYDIDARRARAESREGEKVNMVITPPDDAASQ